MKIDKNIPIPESTKYPWKDMEVGDSFLAKVQSYTAMYQQAKYWAKRRDLKRKWKVSKEDEGFRIWRIE